MKSGSAFSWGFSFMLEPRPMTPPSAWSLAWANTCVAILLWVVGSREPGDQLNLKNESYVILMGGKKFTERYYRDKTGWVKVSARGRKFRATPEQVLNHLLPALAGIKSNEWLKVEHYDVAQARPV